MSVEPLRAPGFPDAVVRRRARLGAAAVFPDASYGSAVHGEDLDTHPRDALDRMRIVPAVFQPSRLGTLVELGREPYFTDVDLATDVGGFRSRLPAYVSAMGSTTVAHRRLGLAVAEQTGRMGIPLVLGENVATVHGYRERREPDAPCFLERVAAYMSAAPDGWGGLVVQQSVEDADAELWNRVYSDPTMEPFLSTGRLGFELKVGQGAKPGLGGLTMVDADEARRLGKTYLIEDMEMEEGRRLRASAPGTFTREILKQQVRLMRNNYPRAKVWVKLFPGRDIAETATTAWDAGADAVTVDGAEGGTGLAPLAFLQEVGLPLLESLRRIPRQDGRCLLASGRMVEGARVVKALALGARAAGFGRAVLLAADEDAERGVQRFFDALALELRLLLSSLGRYTTRGLLPVDVWDPDGDERTVAPAPPAYEPPHR